jgi:predicted transglutaminase-like cysteine proteinase
MMADATTVDEREQLTRVNDFFNRRIVYQEDQVIWNEKDYWATPLEMFGKGAGDCEDYSIAKYATLRLLGIPPERLRLIYVRARLGGAGSTLSQAHMVLGYFPTPTSEPLVLDNMVSEVRPAARRPDLTPVFSFNSEGLWAAGSTSSSADPTTRLSRWRNVLDRMREDGLQ